MGQTIGKISRFIFNIACRITCKDRNSSNDHSTRSSAVVAESEPLIPTTHDSHIISIQTLDDNSSHSSSVLEQSREDRDHRFTDDNDDYFFQANDDKAKVKEITTVTVKKPQVIKKEGKWLMHYCSDHRILLVGEGDFSFSASLAKAFGSAANMVTTSLDSLVVAESEPLIPTTHDSHIISIQTLDGDSSCSSTVLEQSKEDRDHACTDDNADFFKANDDQAKVKEITFTTVTVEKPQVKKEGKWLKHYCSDHRILLVGEGDFSFSASLAKAFGSAANMVATSLDSLDFLEENYPSVKTNIGYLKRRGGILLHGVDATKMASHSIVNEYTYDRIIFNFPLAGFFNESKRQQLRRNRKLLVRAFMENAKKLLASDGEIHIRHKSSAFYKEWGIEELGKQCRLRLIEDVEFKLNHYPGYHNKYGFAGNDDFNCYPSRTYKFGHK